MMLGRQANAVMLLVTRPNLHDPHHWRSMSIETKFEPVARASGTALHRQLFVILRDQIVRGFYPAGGAIPNEEALCAEFSVSRITVRRSVTDLEASGFLVK